MRASSPGCFGGGAKRDLSAESGETRKKGGIWKCKVRKGVVLTPLSPPHPSLPKCLKHDL